MTTTEVKNITELNLDFPKDRITFYEVTSQLTSEEIIEILKEMKGNFSSDKITYYKLTKSKEYVNLFNQYGALVRMDKIGVNLSILSELPTKNYILIAKYTKIYNELKYQLALRNKLKVFNNGKLYKSSEKTIEAMIG